MTPPNPPCRSADPHRGIYRIQVISDHRLVSELRGPWDRLVESDPDCSPFNYFGWVEAWCNNFLDPESARIITVHDGDLLIGGLWLYAGSCPAGTRFRMAGEAWAAGDYLDLVARPDLRNPVAEAIVAHLEEDPEWKVLDLQGLAERSPLIGALEDLARRRGWSAEVATADICPRIDSCSIEEWEDAPDRVFKRIVAKTEKQAANKAAIGLEDSTGLGAGEAARWIEDLMAWSVANWRRRGEISCFENPRMKDFYGLQVSGVMSGSGPAMHRLLVDGEPGAIIFGLWKGPDFYFLQSGVSPLGLEYRAGNLLLNRMLRRCLGQGGRFFFLRGDEIYKYRWGARDTITVRLIVSRSAAWFALRNAWKSIKIPLKRVRDVLRRARSRGLGRTLARESVDMKARVDREWKVRIFRFGADDPYREKLSEMAGVKKLKKISCGPMDESDLIQIRLGRGREIEDAYRSRLKSARAYCAYQGGKLVASVWVTEHSGRQAALEGPDLQADLPDGAGLVFDAWLADRTDGGAAGKLLAHILAAEPAGESWLVLDRGVVARYLEEAGIPPKGTMKARRTLGRLAISPSSPGLPVRFTR